jgi:hypothetical protein
MQPGEPDDDDDVHAIHTDDFKKRGWSAAYRGQDFEGSV